MPARTSKTYPLLAAFLLVAVLSLSIPPSVFAALPGDSAPTSITTPNSTPTTEAVSGSMTSETGAFPEEEAGALAGPGGSSSGISSKANPVGCLGGAAAAAGTAGGWFTGGLSVTDLGNLSSTIITCVQAAFGAIASAAGASGIGYLVAKSKLDVLATGLLQTAIRATKDMVIRWILTGRFEGPVFSGSYAIDAQRSAENAARILLSELTRINFCSPFPALPPQAFFSADLNLTLACTFAGDYEQFLLGNTGDFAQFWASEETANDFWNNSIAALDAKLIAETKALTSFGAEYQAGQGFLCIRDKATGLCTTPGSYVAELVMQSEIVSPYRTTDVAQTVQQAIAEILNTAIRVSIEKGLSQARAKTALPGEVRRSGTTAR